MASRWTSLVSRCLIARYKHCCSASNADGTDLILGQCVELCLDGWRYHCSGATESLPDQHLYDRLRTVARRPNEAQVTPLTS